MFYHFKELVSTNLWMKQHIAELENLSVVTAEYQTAGRGQRGNGWESAPGENLLMSVFITPSRLSAKNQFLISKMASLVVVDAIRSLLPRNAKIKIKWPNDIYVNERKVCGILIENTIGQNGMIQNSIIGIGLNVNQKEFRSDAPNPGSIIQFMPEGTGRIEPETLVGRIVNGIEEYLDDGIVIDGCILIDGCYFAHLRGVNEYLPYAVLTPSVSPAPTALRDTSGREIIEAIIERVAQDGRLDMKLRDGSRRSFYFKEITPILN